MSSRYDLRGVGVNSNPMYDNLFDDRGVKYIEQYRAGRVKYPKQLFKIF